jgi:serine/threonine protein kinase
MVMTKKTFTEEQIAFIAKNVLMGLDYMDKTKKIHRDIKPHNVLLNAKGEAKLGMFA